MTCLYGDVTAAISWSTSGTSALRLLCYKTSGCRNIVYPQVHDLLKLSCSNFASSVVEGHVDLAWLL